MPARDPTRLTALATDPDQRSMKVGFIALAPQDGAEDLIQRADARSAHQPTTPMHRSQPHSRRASAGAPFAAGE